MTYQDEDQQPSITSDLLPTGATTRPTALPPPPTEFGELQPSSDLQPLAPSIKPLVSYIKPPEYQEDNATGSQQSPDVGACSTPASNHGNHTLAGNHSNCRPGNHGNYRPVSRMLWHRKFISSMTLTLVGYSCFHPRTWLGTGDTGFFFSIRFDLSIFRFDSIISPIITMTYHNEDQQPSITSDLLPTGATTRPTALPPPPTEFGELQPSSDLQPLAPSIKPLVSYVKPPEYQEDNVTGSQQSPDVGACSTPVSNHGNHKSAGNHSNCRPGNHGNYRPVSRMLWHRKFISSMTLTLVGYSCFHPRTWLGTGDTGFFFSIRFDLSIFRFDSIISPVPSHGETNMFR
eukprot:sb/3466328/